MIGPTGVGKTEIARRLAKLANAPFLKVEATKFTEVGYVGRDVESIIRDLADAALKMLREQEVHKMRHRAEDAAEERILDALLPPARPVAFLKSRCRAVIPTPVSCSASACAKASWTTRDRHRGRREPGRGGDHGPARHGGDDQPATEPLRQHGQGQEEEPQAEDQGSLQAHPRRGSRAPGQRRRPQGPRPGGGGAERHRLHRRDRQGCQAGQYQRRRRFPRGCAARSAAADRGQHGQHQAGHGQDRPYSLHCLRRLPPVKPSDLVPELQGRLPIRVELKALSPQDFERILTEPHAALTGSSTASC